MSITHDEFLENEPCHQFSLQADTSFLSGPNSRTQLISSGTSSDDSDESFREKFENLQGLVRELSRQLHSEKIRREGIETLSRSLKDERKQNELLKGENKKYESALRILQNRLSTAGLQTSLELHDHESLPSIAGFETLDSLIRENLSLKHEVKYLTVDPLKMDNFMKENISLKERIIRLQQQLSQVQGENHELKSTLASSSDDKLLEISKLQGQLHDSKLRGDSKDVLCQSLSEQSQTLQERLRDTGDMCQQLLVRLEQGSPSSNPTQGLPLGASFLKLSLEKSEGNLKEEHRVLQETMLALKNQLQEVVQVNQKWQEYHTKRELEFKQLRGKLQQMEQLRQSPSSQLTERQQEQIDALILQYKRQIEMIENDKEKIKDENRELRIQLARQVETNQQLESQIKSLLEQLRSRQQGSSINDREMIHALEMQLKIFTEDFNKERRDRERAQARADEMDREIQAYKVQLDSLQRAAMSRINRRRFGAPQRPLLQCDDDEMIDIDNVELPQCSEPPLHLIGRNIDDLDEDGEDEVDMPRRPIPIRTKVQSPETSNLLQCPECQTAFPRNKHHEFVQHMDSCIQ